MKLTAHMAKNMILFLDSVDANPLKFGIWDNVLSIILVVLMNIGVVVTVLVRMGISGLMELVFLFLHSLNVLTILNLMVSIVNVTVDFILLLQASVCHVLQEPFGLEVNALLLFVKLALSMIL